MATYPTDEDFLVEVESALEKQLLPEPGVEVLERTRDAVMGALYPLVAELRKQQPAASSAPADQNLRDRIARAIFGAHSPGIDVWDSGSLSPTDREIVFVEADAVLAVLPAPADRAAVLREAANRAWEHGRSLSSTDDELGIAGEIQAELLRMAGEVLPVVVAYRRDADRTLCCTDCRHLKGSYTPLTADELPDGGICSCCHTDVLIEQAGEGR